MDLGYDPLKKTISKSIGEFLINNLVNQKDKDWLNKIMSGEKLDGRKKDSLSLLINLLKGLYDKGTLGAEDSIEITPTAEDEDQIATREETKPGESTTQNAQPSTSRAHWDSTHDSELVFDTQDPVLNKKDKIGNEKLCKFYNRGKCSKGKNCKFEHPQICKVFRKFGLKKNNEKGCVTSCNEFHPNTCRDSLKTKTCSRPDCRFFHLKDTKTIQKHLNNRTSQSQYFPPGSREYNEFKNKNQLNRKKNLENQNRFSSQMDQTGLQHHYQAPNATHQNQVFQRDSPNLTDTLAAILKQLGEMNQRQTNLEQKFQMNNSLSQSTLNPWAN